MIAPCRTHQGTGNTTLTELFDINVLAGYRHCYFVLRSDHARKPGGDVDLAWQLARKAQAAGAAVSIVGVTELPPVLESRDLLFLFNIDRPYDAVAALDRADPNSRILLYTLHHPAAGVSKYLSRVGGPRGWLAMIARAQPNQYEAMVDAAKALRTRDVRRLRVALGRKRAITRLIDRCELLVTSPAELAEIGACYGAPSRATWLLPHPVAPHAALARMGVPRYVLVAGRIEPRKNQLAALQGLAAMDLQKRGYEIMLVGGAGSDIAYFRDTIDFALANNIIYVSQLPKQLFFPAVSGAALVINASFFEVTSLIDLYAIDNGIPLVTTAYGYYAPAASLRQVSPQAWGPAPATALVDAIEAMLAFADASSPPPLPTGQ